MSKLNNWFTKFNSENTIISFVETDKDCMKNGYYGGSSSYKRGNDCGYSDGGGYGNGYGCYSDVYGCGYEYGISYISLENGYGSGSGDGNGFGLENGKGFAYREYNDSGD